MVKERDTLNLKETIDIEELSSWKKSPPKRIDQAQIDQISEKTGFISREPRKQDKEVQVEEKVRGFHFKLPESLHKSFKIKVTEKGESMNDVLIQMIKGYINT